MDHETREYYDRTLANSVLVPAGQALLTAIPVACLVAVFALLATDTRTALISALGAGLLAFSLAMLWIAANWEPVRRIESRPAATQVTMAAEPIRREEIRLIPSNAAPTPPHGVDPRDLAYFIGRIFTETPGDGRPWAKRRWVDVADLPSSRSCDWEYYSEMITLLEKAGFITGRSERSAGELRGTAEDALRVFGLLPIPHNS